jgi:hypothetical protein
MSGLEAPDPDKNYTGSYYETIGTRTGIVSHNNGYNYDCGYDLESDQEYIYTICNDDGSNITIGEERVFSDENFMFYKINGQYVPETMRRIKKEEINSEENKAYDEIMQELQERELQEREQDASEKPTQTYEDEDEDEEHEQLSSEYSNIKSSKVAKDVGSRVVNKRSVRVQKKALLIAKKSIDKGLSKTKKTSSSRKGTITGGVGSLRRNITVSNHTGKNAFQSRGKPEHITFFWHIWNHFAPIRYKHPSGAHKIYIKMPIYHHSDGRFICNILLRRNFKPGNIIYSVLFEFTNLIHWSIFYSHRNSDMNVYQVSQFHITINPFRGVQKTRIFFEYTPYIDGEVHWEDRVMGVVSQLMIRTMYQLLSGRSLSTNFIMDADFMGLRSVIDEAGFLVKAENELTNISRQHIDLVEMIQHVLSDNFGLNDIIDDIRTLSAPAGAAAGLPAATGHARPGGGSKNINRYLTKINNIKEKLKLLKKNKVKNKVKITKLRKSIDELKAKLKKQKEKEKAKLKKQKEKEIAKLKKQKEKEKAKLKKQKEKEKAKRKKTKAKKS